MFITVAGRVLKLYEICNLYSFQIKELEENLKKEILTKSELLSKIADAELLNVALKNDLAKQNSVSSEILTKNIALQVKRNSFKVLVNRM